MAEAIAARGRRAREQAGLLTGYAAGTADAAPAAAVSHDLLADVAELEGRAKADQLASALKPYGITTGQVWGTAPEGGKGANRRGIDRADLTKAITERDKKRAA